MMAPDQDQWELIRLQVAQGMMEHEIVAQALRATAVISALFVVILGSICFFLWRRCACLNEALLVEISRHSRERLAMLREHSLQLSSTMMQMQHSFEGLVSRKRKG